MGIQLRSSKCYSWFFFSFALLYISSVFADEIFASAPAGNPFGHASREPKYKIVYHSTSFPFHSENEHESVVMTNKEGQRYICFLPVVEETKPLRPVSQPNSTSIVFEADRNRIKLKSPDEIIDLLKEKCVYRNEGWWTYEFCHQKHVRQLHLEDDKPVQEFVLGVYDSIATTNFNQGRLDSTIIKDPRSKEASQRYHPHLYSNGTLCDLTNEPRETEIRFICSESSVAISSIKEVSTCKYVVNVQCPMLCKHPMFYQERSLWHTIHCNEDSKDTKAATEEYSKATQIRTLSDDSDHNAT